MRRGLASLAIAAFAMLVVLSGLDRLAGQRQGAGQALHMPLRSEAWVAEAAQMLGAGRFAEAEAAAMRAIASDPLDRRGAAFLGAARTMQGDTAGAQAAFVVADRLSRREPLTQAYFFGVALEAGDYAAAAGRIETLLRTHPQFAPVQTYLAQLGRTAGGRAVLLQRVASDPRWAGAYLDGYAVDEATLRERARTLAGGGIPCPALAPFLRNLEERGLAEDAATLRARACPRQDG